MSSSCTLNGSADALLFMSFCGLTMYLYQWIVLYQPLIRTPQALLWVWNELSLRSLLLPFSRNFGVMIMGVEAGWWLNVQVIT